MLFGKNYNNEDRQKCAKILTYLSEMPVGIDNKYLGKVENLLSLPVAKVTKNTIAIDDTLIDIFKAARDIKSNSKDVFVPFYNLITEVLFYRQDSLESFDKKEFEQKLSVWNNEIKSSILLGEIYSIEEEIKKYEQSDNDFNKNQIKILNDNLLTKKRELEIVLYQAYDRNRVQNIKTQMNAEANMTQESPAKITAMIKNLQQQRVKNELARYKKDKAYEEFQNRNLPID